MPPLKSYLPILISIWGLCCLLLPAHATLLRENSSTFGNNSLVLDTQTGLTWLDLPYTTGVSYTQMLADLQAGGTFSGFRYATEKEVFSLFNSAGITATGFYPLNNSSVLSLISLVGDTETFNGYPGISAVSGTPGVAIQEATQVALDLQATIPYGMDVYDYSFSINLDYGDVNSGVPTVGNWLVEVPEPRLYSILLVGVVSFALIQLRLASTKRFQ